MYLGLWTLELPGSHLGARLRNRKRDRVIVIAAVLTDIYDKRAPFFFAGTPYRQTCRLRRSSRAVLSRELLQTGTNCCGAPQALGNGRAGSKGLLVY